MTTGRKERKLCTVKELNTAPAGGVQRVGGYAVRFVPYDIEYCRRSYSWLTDPEIRELTMTPSITVEAQEAWFAGLALRTDYYIRGIECSGEPIGAVGLKHIDTVRKDGEYWGYIGVREYHGRGIGRLMTSHIGEIADMLGLRRLYLKVVTNNVRAYALYCHQGFREYASENGVVFMEKSIPG